MLEEASTIQNSLLVLDAQASEGTRTDTSSASEPGATSSGALDSSAGSSAASASRASTSSTGSDSDMAMSAGDQTVAVGGANREDLRRCWMAYGRLLRLKALHPGVMTLLVIASVSIGL